MTPAKAALTACVALALGACSMAPVYHVPDAPVPGVYKEAGPWQAATPADRLDRGDWWTVYSDTTLDALEGKVDPANADLAAALARYDEARAYAQQARAGLFPQLAAGVSATGNRQSDNRPLRSANQPTYYGNNTLDAEIDYELDLWGRVRNEVAAGNAGAQAAAADLASVRLSLHAELADDYLVLRGLDAQAQLLADTVEAYQHALKLTENRFGQGVASGLDVARAQTQVETAEGEAGVVRARRALYEHAIASLVGEPASDFSIAPAVQTIGVPAVPVGVPSTLLERRPDIAAAERRAAAANAEIGVAKAAFFPRIVLDALGGFQNTGGAGWLTAPNLFWTIGPSAVATVFDGGRRHAKVAQAEALENEAAARYRGTVLGAFQQVEDNLALLRELATAAKADEAAVASSGREVDIAMNRYREGVIDYLEVVTAQTRSLQTQRTELDIRTQRLTASVNLIRALGGGWSRASLDRADGAPDVALATPPSTPAATER
jgi:NodT family efflux transporter outer membrane factor (OMF) lipoprotein